ncbi:MAG: hypothetical protein GXO22_06375 [Aquificae bacterium]|nr:hypothetical protein [Aquificota bacterium]
MPAILSNIMKKTKLLAGIQLEGDIIRILVVDKENLTTYNQPIEYHLSEDEKENIPEVLKRELLGLNIGEPIDAVVGLPISVSLIKNLKLPKMDKKDLMEAIEWNIKEEMQTIKGDTIYDFDILGEENDMYNIIVVVAKKSDIERLEQIEKEAGIKILHIDSNPIALINISILQKERKGVLGEEDNAVCSLYIDEDISYIIYYQNGLSTETLSFKLKDFKTFEESEPELTKLINEINYFFLTVNEPPVVYIAGAILEYPDVKEYIQSKFIGKFAFVDIDPPEILGINYVGDKHPGVYAVPFGLIYRGLEE